MNNIDTAFKGAAGLTNDYYEALVTASMEPHRLAVARAKARKDTLTVESAVYNDLGTKLNALNSSITALRENDTGVFKTKTTSVSEAGIVTASATSSASNSVYDINVTQLAAAHRIRGDAQANSTSGLGYGASSFIINGVTIDVDADASLSDIRDAINNTVATAIDDGAIETENGFTASIINHSLVLTADSTGSAHELAITDTDGLLNNIGMFNWADLQEAKNAIFTVNNIEVSRSGNSAIDDVIEGVTLNLSKEGETQLTIAPNSNGVRNAINSFVSAFNDLNTWLAAKTGVREGTDGNYIRGVLADTSGLKNMRRDLVQKIFGTWSGAPTTATYKRLDQLGIDLGEGLALSITDAAKLTDALTNNYSEVAALFEGVLEKVQSTIEPYVKESNNRVDQMKSAAESALEIQNTRIKQLETAMANREELVRDQIASQFSIINSYNSQGRFLTSMMYSVNTYG